MKSAIFLDNATKVRVRAFFLDNPERQMVTIPANDNDLLDESVSSDTGIWPLNEFNKRFKVI